MTLGDFYAAVGGDIKTVLQRIPSEAMVKKFVLKYPADPTCAELDSSIAAGDWDTAFRAAHTLKGVSQNLGFEELYRVSFELTEALRGGKALQDKSLHEAVRAENARVIAAIEALDK